MKEVYKEINLRKDSLDIVNRCDAIIERYQAQGLRLTLRQLYYQLVTQNIIANAEKQYKRLSSIVSDARLAGLLDWDAIEDRVRQPKQQSQFDNVEDLVNAALHSYRLPRWADQDYYVELWVEKDALAGVLAPIARQYHITLMVNRGYSSQSAMYESAARFKESDNEKILIYLGDFDPSGEDMVRDIESRLTMFGVEGLTVTKVALTMAQVRQYRPPPNPAKLTDPRADAYVAEHGSSSWEVDALPPETLQQIIRDALEDYTDWDRMNAVIATEEKHKKALKKAAAKIE